MKAAIRKHAFDFALVLGLVLVSALVGGYILSNQRFYLPHWVPVVGSDFVDYKAQFSTAQSVTPGQGQTVQIAGVDVGDITKVDLVDGRAVVTMKIRRKYLPIYRNATALLRPKTGLNDMVIELDPGTQTAGTAPAGFTVPIDQTLPNVNFDEILSSLDADTRTYLQLLVGGAGEGLDGQGKALSATLKRFEPTGRYLARLNGALALRDRNIRRAIHNFSLLSQAVGAKDDDLAALVDSSNRVFKVFADQDVNLRAGLQELPGALDATNTTLAKVTKLGNVLGPTLGALRPGARALGPSLVQTRPFLTETTPIIKNQLRPFARAALPVVTVLRPAARDLALVTPKLTTSVQVLNYLLNTLAYNPPGKEEGYLYWAAWANHDGATVFSSQDAHGPIRHGLVLASCSTLQVLHQLSGPVPQLGTLGALLNPPDQNVVCPTTGQARSTPAQPGTTTPAVPAPPVRGQGRTR
jgi:phospholipid/cholesterol/gamma-HCH transport system substrate-binding protein